MSVFGESYEVHAADAIDIVGKQYQIIWEHLNQLQCAPFPEHWANRSHAPSFGDALRYFTHNGCSKELNLTTLSKADATYLASLGISVRQLERNLRETTEERHLDPLGFQLDALREHAMSAFCPHSGKRVHTQHSLLANINVIFYRFQGAEIFYLVTAGIGSGRRKSAIYFPASDLVITAGDAWGFQADDLCELKARMVSSAQECIAYFSAQHEGTRQTAVCLGFYHFAHHLWNELSGLQRLHQHGLLQSVDRFLVLREPLGPLEQIFPEIAGDKLVRKQTTSDLFKEILAKGYFVVSVGDNYLSRDLADRVTRVSLALCSPGTHAMASQARTAHSPLIWLGIRVGNRAWANQVEGLSEVIASLKEQFPRLGIVFDGFSLPADRSASTNEDEGFSTVLAEEQGVVQRILDNLQQRQVAVDFYNIIGHSISDANVWAHAIDVYLSPYGSLQHKVGWFTNKYGIVHSNRALLQNPAKYVWEAVENGIPPRYIDAGMVTDILSEEEERIFYNELKDASETGAGLRAANKRLRASAESVNYSVQGEALYREMLALVRSPKMETRVAANVWAHRARRKVRRALRGFARLSR